MQPCPAAGILHQYKAKSNEYYNAKRKLKVYVHEIEVIKNPLKLKTWISAEVSVFSQSLIGLR
jgi:hypothetical protein